MYIVKSGSLPVSPGPAPQRPTVRLWDQTPLIQTLDNGSWMRLFPPVQRAPLGAQDYL